MRPRPLAFDLTRLIARLRHAAPSGIDRVDLAYARHVLGGPGERFGLVSTALGPRVLDRGRAAAIVEAVADGWVEGVEAETDPVYRRLAVALGAATPDAVIPDAANAAAGARPDARGRRRLQVRVMLDTLRRPGVAALPPGTIYLNTSHMGLERPRRFDWLYGRRDVRAVFFVHDLIPISHPEYGRRGEAERHAARMRTIARHAAHVVVNSADVGARFTAYAAGQGLSASSVTVAPLGVEPIFQAHHGPAPVFAKPTFLACGTIESRKNHLLLLQLWRDMAERLGADTPRLVIVGRRGWEAENVVDLLDRCRSLRPYVVEVSGLSTPGLARVMRGATALLMPSFIEGYGLPVVEAAASRLPVLASDIPVHREIADGYVEFLDPLDGPGWATTIEALNRPDSRMREDLAARLAGYRPPSWPAHFEPVDASLDRLGPVRRA